ncbi:S53 family peptidase [Desulfotomaculum copahuensis]|uniref:Peptidase S53 domain-containing protein n=1 Tax=Desulfotomaculum copahuensis TaxID=1838280 RepID=A0A1B7LBP1_9FIRM|nr:S53 family peptidase [Desulfotomaculum copahuensis]OAT79898.1 hypothetical protein A6M21_14395 [Desulfotomaculum copahuensis]
MNFQRLISLLLCLFLLAGAVPAFAAGADGGVPLAGSVLPLLGDPGCRQVGPLDPDRMLSLTVVLRPQEKFDPPVREQAASRFRTPAAAAEQPLIDYLMQCGLAVNPGAGGLTISAGGTAAAVAKALHVQLFRYVYQGEEFFANDRPVTLPPDLSAGVAGVFGLNNFQAFHSLRRSIKIKKPAIRPLLGRQPYTPPYIPAEIHKIYGFDQAYAAGLNGAGVTAAVVTFASFNQSDVDKFTGGLDLPSGGGTEVVPVDGGSGAVDFNDNSSVETTMDVENLLSSAPGCRLLVYEAPASATARDMIDAFSQLVNDHRAQVVSLSWGSDDGQLTEDFYVSMDAILQAGAAEGITFVGASGDDGGDHPVFPAEDPYFTAVGGTQLQLNAADGSLAGETGWTGSGGGPSWLIPAPAWQQGAFLPASGYRMSPDIAFDAAPETGYALYYNGGWNYDNGTSDGGTSAAAPEVAAAIVLVDQAQARQHRPPLGAVNQALYGLGAAGSRAVRPVTEGSNGPYQCGSGYNMVTGWGVPRVFDLITALTGFSAAPTVSITADSLRAATGDNVAVTATAGGITNPQYQFWIQNPLDQSWSSSGDYSGSGGFTFTESIPGTYTVLACARSGDGSGGAPVQSAPVTITFFSSRPAVSALAVTGPNGSQPAGGRAVFTAAAADPGGVPEYQFWVHDATGWRAAQDYSTRNTFALDSLQPGSYVVVVYALDQNDFAAGRWTSAYRQSFVLNVASSVRLNAPAGAVTGGTVDLTALAAGLTGAEYQFWYQSPDGSWHGSDYSSANSFHFTAGSPGVYHLVVYAKDHYAPNTARFSVFDTAAVNVQ